ncbi:ribonuclease H-like domain-containing protein [Artemisia annua]|uniref:Ribonuclease H-like domain-containing protein n=1 Tax=Artemisia annua TaxID=35608 RepID=A0A2U1Q3I9_ARTAN|nr:ribonuclease H-like domain-containing protein [Artemisia annua]
MKKVRGSRVSHPLAWSKSTPPASVQNSDAEEDDGTPVTLIRSVISQRSQSSVFHSNVPNRGSSQRPQTSGNSFRPNNASRTNGNGINRAAGGPTLICENCGYNGHTVDRCFKLIGYPANFGKRTNNNSNQGAQNFNKRFIHNNNSVGSSSLSNLSDEQISKLLSLIKDTYVGSGMGGGDGGGGGWAMVAGQVGGKGGDV